MPLLPKGATQSSHHPFLPNYPSNSAGKLPEVGNSLPQRWARHRIARGHHWANPLAHQRAPPSHGRARKETVPLGRAQVLSPLLLQQSFQLKIITFPVKDLKGHRSWFSESSTLFLNPAPTQSLPEVPTALRASATPYLAFRCFMIWSCWYPWQPLLHPMPAHLAAHISRAPGPFHSPRSLHELSLFQDILLAGAELVSSIAVFQASSVHPVPIAIANLS